MIQSSDNYLTPKELLSTSLTTAQATLCADLISGLSLKDIAAVKHKSEETLRSHLRSVFQKTGFNRQGQLMSSILSALME